MEEEEKIKESEEILLNIGLEIEEIEMFLQIIS